MISYYLGIPGSGKTYSAVNTIYNNFTDNEDAKRDLKKDYVNCYTNINEFRFNLCHDVYPLDFDDLYEKLTILFNLYHGIEKEDNNDLDTKIDKRKLSLSELKDLARKKQLLNQKNISKKPKATDEELIRKAKELNIFKTLFVIDECHNFFDTADKVKIWWLTYHRHLYHDIILITQSLSLVDLKYKPLAEAFYKAKPMSLTFNKNYFNYMYYTEARLTSASYVNTIKVKRRASVFKLYKSGDSVKSKNIILRFIFISIGLMILLFGFAYYFYFTKEKEISSHKKIQNNPPMSVSVKKEESKDIDTTELIYMQFLCTVEMCSYKNLYFDIKLLAFARENFNLEILSSRRVFSQTVVSVVVDSSFKNFIGVAYDQFNSEDKISSINPFSSGK